ncbi:hypothetical protein GDO86_017008 [Hymenochirus boettgeri]|nr:hypothetical protein GDO86_017008 [Hymenochirus boettgeri]KAG8432593.1 hypothetical protein GDO86_017008 [Hymenochirus boettgeri]
MPVEDASVDLVNAEIAAHWFNTEKFLQETARVLKHGGCLALHAFLPDYEIHYKDCSEELTRILSEALEMIYSYNKQAVTIVRSQYEDIFRKIPFADKKRITGIQETFLLNVEDIINLVRSACFYQEFFEKDKDEATEFLKNLEKRFLGVLENSSSRQLEFTATYFCILATKL